MKNSDDNTKIEINKFEISTNIETVDVNNSKWHGTVKNNMKEMDVTVHSISALFSRNELLLESMQD